MKLVTKESLVKTCAKRFKDTYEGVWTNNYAYPDEDYSSFKGIYDKLKRARKLTEKKIAEITGIHNLTENICHCCRKDCKAVVDVDGEVSLCEKCLTRAFNKIKK